MKDEKYLELLAEKYPCSHYNNFFHARTFLASLFTSS